MISLIAVVDEQGGLGKNNQLLCHLPADLRYFKQITMGKPVIMGRNTFEAIGRLLPERTNIIITHQNLKISGAYICNDIEQAINLVSDVSEAMIIGGASIYQQTLHIADQIYLTEIHHSFHADVFFPQINRNEWKCIEQTFRQKDEKNIYDMTFSRYTRKNKHC